jgi:hypothetical protein
MSNAKAMSLRATTGGRLVSNGRPFCNTNVITMGTSGAVVFNPSLVDGDKVIVELTAGAAVTVGSGTAIPNPHADDEGRVLTFVKISNFAHTVTFASDVAPLGASHKVATFSNAAGDAALFFSFSVLAKAGRWYLIGASAGNAAGTPSVAWS